MTIYYISSSPWNITGTFFPIPLLKSGDKEDINRLIPFRIHFPPFHSQDPELDSGSSEVEKEDVLTEF